MKGGLTADFFVDWVVVILLHERIIEMLIKESFKGIVGWLAFTSGAVAEEGSIRYDMAEQDKDDKARNNDTADALWK